MVTIERYKSTFYADVSALSVQEGQSSYVATAKDLLDGREGGWEYHVIQSNGAIVGFFNIDIHYSQRYEFATNGDVGLRAFFVDKHHQGKGIARSALSQLNAYVGENYPAASTVCLTVNCKNEVAYIAYLKNGFVDSGELYLGGSAGPQHVLRMQLDRR